jgi:hypothetical protein
MRWAVLVVGCVAVAGGTAGAFVPPGSKLLAGDASGSAGFGSGVALSADGTTALVGGPADGAGTGAAWVFVRTAGGGWSQQGAKLVGSGATGGAQMGSSVALSADGNTALIGGPGDSGGTGAAWVFVRSGGVWTQQGGKLLGSNVSASAAVGTSVALSADGNTALAGGPGDAKGDGAAWVFVRTSSAWAQQDDKLSLPGSSSGLGDAVALSGDGNTALLGNPGPTSGGATGGAFVFVRSAGNWSPQGTELAGTGVAGADSEEGHAVALSSDGDTALIGGPDSANGGALVFVRSGTGWSQQGGPLVGTGGAIASAMKAGGVALSGDGNTALVGESAGVGGAWLFTRSGVAWSRQGGLLSGSGAMGASAQGTSVALSSDTGAALLGGPGDNGSAGAAWAFVNATPASPPSSGVLASASAAGGTPSAATGAPIVMGTGGAAFSALVGPNGLPTTMHFEYGIDAHYRPPGTPFSYDRRTPEQAVGADFGSHNVNATIGGLIPNAIYHVRAVATNAAGTTDGSDRTFRTAMDPAPPAPVLGKRADFSPVSGVVFVTPGKGRGFIPLTEPRALPVGSVVDARSGSLKLVTATARRNKTQVGTFSAAVFQVLQSRQQRLLGLTTLRLQEGTFSGAPSYASCPAARKGSAGRAFAAALSTKVLQLLHATAHGHFQTRGRYSAATVRGTSWDTEDRCDGTLTVVHRGVVVVDDFRLHKQIVLRAGKRYLARL